ncbi:MAG: hypothetical protein C0459_14890 [Chitinophaga sp.]|jgi:peroxiredoxin|nr:hypothetical protein [Chitinophaga sp.]
MKLIVVTSFLLLFITKSNAQNIQNKYSGNFSIKGTTTTANSTITKIFLTYFSSEKNALITDSVSVNNNSFRFNGAISEPQMLTLRFTANKKGQRLIRPPFSIFTEAADLKITINDSIQSIKVEGSRLQKEMEALQKKQNPYLQKADSLQRLSYVYLYQQKDSLKSSIAKSNAKNVIAEMQQKVIIPFINEQSNSPVTIPVLFQLLNSNYNNINLSALYAKLSSEVKKLPSADRLKQQIEKSNITSAGNAAPVFSSKDTAGNAFSLSSLTDKPIILQFMSSKNRATVNAARQTIEYINKNYSDKAFNIITIAIEKNEDKADWIKCIKENKLNCINLSDLNLWNSEVVNLYNVKKIPQCFIINKGKIIANNSDPEEQIAFLKKNL